MYHRTKILGQDVYQLVVPESRRAHVLKMGHDSFGGHMGFKRTRAALFILFIGQVCVKIVCGMCKRV